MITVSKWMRKICEVVWMVSNLSYTCSIFDAPANSATTGGCVCRCVYVVVLIIFLYICCCYYYYYTITLPYKSTCVESSHPYRIRVSVVSMQPSLSRTRCVSVLSPAHHYYPAEPPTLCVLLATLCCPWNM